ncbi:MAG: helical backbone metal receptor [Raineya sp.]|jgi:ABC-type Fe3+-hydroxamate transport system substrate-binding protein|nr:helical backbone metal receptor [Raineya sp.]
MIFTDQMGREITLSHTPQRIISLVPSQTELLFDLGLKNKVVGITKFCIHPSHEVKQITKIGGTKKFDFDVIDNLKPDLIIGNKEENYQDGIEYLTKKYPVWMSDIYTLDDSLKMIRELGNILDTLTKAHEIAQSIETSFQNLPLVHNIPKVAYFIWRQPWMIATTNTFIDYILQKIGFLNAFRDLERYPEITLEHLQESNPEYIFLSSEPYPFKEKHIQELQSILPHSKILLVDGEMFSWYGSRLLKSVEYFKKIVATL